MLAEIRRQLQWSVATIQRMDAEKQGMKKANGQLLARREYYAPKNNGKGRPPKPLQAMSDARRYRLARLRVEANLLQQLMPLFRAASDPRLALRVTLENISSTDESAVSQIRVEKLKSLLKQFRTIAQPLAHGALAWSESDVRHYFALLAKVQKTKRVAVSKIPLRIEAEKIEDDRQHAMTLLLDDIRHSNHLDSAKKFHRATEVWRHGPPNYKALVPERWSRTWQEVIDQLWYDLKKIFAVPAP